MKKLSYIFAFTLILFSSAFSFDLSQITLTKGLKRYTLPNGLKVIIKEEHSVPLVGITVNYAIGSRNAPTGKSGLAHLLEHMMFKGTTNLAKGQIDKVMLELGAKNNAYTAYENTAYHEILPAAGLERAIELEADRMVNSLFDPEEFQKEVNVVLSEISARQGNPFYTLMTSLFRETLGDHPISYIYGILSDISNANLSYVYHDLYRKYYVPNNATVFIVGDVEAEQAMQWIRKYFGSIKPAKEFKPLAPQPMKWNLKADVSLEGIASEDFGVILYDLPKTDIKNPDFIALSFISWANILGGFSYWNTRDGGIGFSRYSKEAVYPADTIDPETIRKNFDYYKNRLLNQERLQYDSIESMMYTMVWLDSDSSIDDYDRLMKGFNNLTADQVINVIQKYLTKDNSVKGFFKATTKDKNARPLSAQGGMETHGGDADFSELINFTPEQLAKAGQRLDTMKKRTLDSLESYLSTVQTKTLDNGLTILYRPFTLNDKVSISVGIKAGSVYQELPKQADLTYYFVFNGGPQTAIYNELVKSGTSVSSKSDFNTSGMKIDLPKEQYSQAINMLGLSLKDRQFLPLILEEEKLRRITALEQFKRNTEAVNHAQKVLNQHIFGKTGGGLDFEFTARQIAELSMQDIRDYYHNLYRPENTIISVVGNIDFNTVVKEIERQLGDWKPAPQTRVYLPAELQIPHKTVRKKVKVPSSYQSVVLMAAPTVDYSDTTNYTSYLLANEIFGGGGFSSRLMTVIRDTHGLTYGVYSYPYPYGQKNMFRLYMQNAPEDVDQAIGYFEEQLQKYKAEGPTDMELVKFKTSMIMDQLFNYENASKIADRLLYYQIRRGQFDYDKDFIEMLHKTGKDAVKQVIDKFFPENLFIIEAGN